MNIVNLSLLFISLALVGDVENQYLDSSEVLFNELFGKDTHGFHAIDGSISMADYNDLLSDELALKPSPRTIDQVDYQSNDYPKYLDPLELGKIASYLSNLYASRGDDEISNTIQDEELAVSGPINDPTEFGASLKHQDDANKENFPSSSNSSVKLDEFMSTYLGSEVGRNEGKSAQGALSLHEDRDRVEDSTFQPHGNNGEYIDHPLALEGHQYVQGGAGEGKQLLGPDGTFENVQVVKSDSAVPSYCDPPNPCPIGYSAEDGCLEKFVNSASFSREYQAKQHCSCDNEHSLFNCATPVSTLKEQSKSGSKDKGEDDESVESSGTVMPLSKLKTLARTIKNRFGGIDGVTNLLRKQESDVQFVD